MTIDYQPLLDWAELFPEGRVVCYEGDDPVGFAAEIHDRFGFDPSADPAWDSPYTVGDPGWGRDPFGRTNWFHCPAELLDDIYGTGDYPMGS
jgi:hypothetical protein